MNKEHEEYVLGDELDNISIRDVAAMRSVRHQEWLDDVIGNNTSTTKLINLDPLFPASTQVKEWSFSDTNSLKKKLAEIQGDIDKLKTSGIAGDETEENLLPKVYREDIAKLRETFGSTDSPADEITKDLESRFNISLIERKRVRQVDTNLDLPEYASAPERSDEHIDATSELTNFDSIPGLEDVAVHLDEDAVMTNL